MTVFELLSRKWHDAFGEVKCWSTDCPVCAETDWPVASWVVRRDPPPGGRGDFLASPAPPSPDPGMGVG